MNICPIVLLLVVVVSKIVGYQNFNINILINYDTYLSSLLEKMSNLKNIVTPFVINVGYNLMYCFSICQIQMNKMKNRLVPYLKILEKFLNDKNIIVKIKTQIIKKIDKNGNIENTLIISDKTPLETVPIILDENSVGVILYDTNVDTGCVNCVYSENMEITRDYKVSKISFMSVELEHETKKHTIELKNASHNYYIVNNSLNQNFLKYYLKTVLKTDINEDNFEYNLSIIDNNVNFITLNHHQHIIINEYGYKIYPEEIKNTFTTEDIIEDIIEDHISISGNESDKSSDFVNVKLDDEC